MADGILLAQELNFGTACRTIRKLLVSSELLLKIPADIFVPELCNNVKEGSIYHFTDTPSMTRLLSGVI
jgi:hypothetical protein